jgi:hypothetical protein
MQTPETIKPKPLKTKQSAFHIPNAQIAYGIKLGEGGFGEVYKATWNHNDVAVKKLLLKNRFCRKNNSRREARNSGRF